MDPAIEKTKEERKKLEQQFASFSSLTFETDLYGRGNRFEGYNQSIVANNDEENSDWDLPDFSLMADLEEDNVDMEQVIENPNYDSLDLDSVSKLRKTVRYIDIMDKLEVALSNQSMMVVPVEDNPEYQLIVDCNQLSVDIDNEIFTVHNFIRDKYRLRLPELESLVHHPIDYARVVKKIANETDLSSVDLHGILPSATIMVVTITASTTSGKQLPNEVLQKTIEACDCALELDLCKKKVIDFVESRMGYIAPNLSAIVGSVVAAKLMVTAGGLMALAEMPACNVQLLGSKRKNLVGFSTATSNSRVGYLDETEIIQRTPPALRTRACRLLAAKATLAARVDYARRLGYPTGEAATGKLLLGEIHKKIDKWQERAPAKQPKPLPLPVLCPKKKRGGRRRRKEKERYNMTEMRKQSNRMQFGVPEQSSLGEGYGEGYGMLGHSRVSAVWNNKLSAKLFKKLKYSSLTFTPMQGMELSNPQAFANQMGSGTQSTYFSQTGAFSMIKRT